MPIRAGGGAVVKLVDNNDIIVLTTQDVNMQSQVCDNDERLSAYLPSSSPTLARFGPPATSAAGTTPFLKAVCRAQSPYLFNIAVRACISSSSPTPAEFPALSHSPANASPQPSNLGCADDGVAVGGQPIASASAVTGQQCSPFSRAPSPSSALLHLYDLVQGLLSGKITTVDLGSTCFLSCLRGSFQRLGCNLASAVLLAILPLPVEAPSCVIEIGKIMQPAAFAQPDKKTTKRCPPVHRPPQVVSKCSGKERKPRKLGKKAKWSARDGNVGGAWGSKQSRDAKLANALKKEKMASQSHGRKLYQSARHTLTSFCSNIFPLLRNLIHIPGILGTKTPVTENLVNDVSFEPQVTLVFRTQKELKIQ